MPTWLKVVGPILAIAGAILATQAYIDARITAALAEQAAAEALLGNVPFTLGMERRTGDVLGSLVAADALGGNDAFRELVVSLVPEPEGADVIIREVPIRYSIENEITTEMTGYNRGGRTVRSELGSVDGRFCYLSRVSGYFDTPLAHVRVYRDGTQWIAEASQRGNGDYEIQAGATCIAIRQ